MKTLLLATFIALAEVSSAWAGTFLDLTSVTAGTSGSFSGTLGPVNVNGSITASTAGFQFNNPTGTNSWEESTINNTSPQFSYSNVFTPTIALTDRVGYTSFGGSFNPATITINFSSAVVNPIFQVANLDSMRYDFSSNAGISLVLLKGNGGGGDGILVTGDVISDANPATLVGQAPSQQPLLSGPRSAYGSVELQGTFTTLTINVSNPDHGGDGGSFTLAAVPEPGSMALFGSGVFGLAGILRRKLMR
jgi:hypothetical protein